MRHEKYPYTTPENEDNEPCDCGCHYSSQTKETGVHFDGDEETEPSWCCSCWERAIEEHAARNEAETEAGFDA